MASTSGSSEAIAVLIEVGASERVHVVDLVPGTVKIRGLGILDPFEVIAPIPHGATVTIGQKVLRRVPARLPELLQGMNRRAQTISPKDAGAFIAKMGIGGKDQVLEAGLGSAALSLHILRCLGDGGRLVSMERREEHAEVGMTNIEALLPSACNSTQALSTPLASGETHLIPLQCIVPDTAGPGELTMPIEIRTDSGAEQLQASVRVERTGPNPPLTMTVVGGPVDLIGSNEGSLRVRLQNPSNGPIQVDLSVLTSNGLQVTVGWDEGDGTDLHLDAGGERMGVELRCGPWRRSGSVSGDRRAPSPRARRSLRRPPSGSSRR